MRTHKAHVQLMMQYSNLTNTSSENAHVLMDDDNSDTPSQKQKHNTQAAKPEGLRQRQQQGGRHNHRSIGPFNIQKMQFNQPHLVS